MNHRFSIILSIEGTYFNDIEFMVPDKQISIRSLVALIISNFSLPHEDSDGNTIQYMLCRNTDSGCLVLYPFDEAEWEMCLQDYGVQENDHLFLTTRQALDGGLTFEVLSDSSVELSPEEYSCDAITDTESAWDNEPVISYNATGNDGNSSVFDINQKGKSLNHPLPEKSSVFSRLVRKVTQSFSKREYVNSTVFAPYETERGEVMTVQVMFYKDSQYDQVKAKARMIDPDAAERNNQVIGVPLQKGDVISAHLSFFCPNADKDYIIIESNDKHISWNNNVEVLTFPVFIDERFNRKILNGKVVLKLKEIPILEMAFNVRVVNVKDSVSALADVYSERLGRVFISYSHLDTEKVKYISETCRAIKCDYFFDRHMLAPGDIYEKKIFRYIDQANLFILCWSKNAEASEWVGKERKRALENMKRNSGLRIYPISMQPKAEVPVDMKDILFLEELS